MKKLIALVVFFLMLTLGIGGMIAQAEHFDLLSLNDKQKIQNKFTSYTTDNKFSGAIYAVYHNDVIYDQGAGMANKMMKNGTDVAYGVASLTKEFTAAAIVQLSEKGKLDISDKLSKYFPGYRYGDDITIWHLLAQRSGIPDYSVDSDDGKVYVSCFGTEYSDIMIDPSRTAVENRDKIRTFFLSKELLFEPGDYYDYSDSNYALLAEIVTRVSGMEYHDYVRENIFEPLGMEHSAFIDDYDPNVITKVAQTDRSEFDRDYFTVKGAEYGCGDLLTTPKDWYIWYRGLTGGKVVSDSSYQLMTKNYSVREELGYGFGLMISDEGDSKAVYHYGYIPSFYSAAIYIPEYDYFEIVFSNHAQGDPHKLAYDMAVYLAAVIDMELGDIS